MIVYDTSCSIDFPSYGMLIPQYGSRAAQVVDSLLQDPHLGQCRGQWLYDEPLPQINRDDLLRAHSLEYVDALFSHAPEPALMRTFELIDEAGNYHRYAPDQAEQPLAAIVKPELANVAGTYQACLLALNQGFAYFLGGGMHHAMRNGGRGFCVFNDIVIALFKLLARGRINRAWIIDVDAHRGDGTAELCLDEKRIKCLSIHMAEGWPLDAPPFDREGNLRRERYPGDVDIPIAAGQEKAYLPALTHGLHLLEALETHGLPDLAVIVNGSDPYEKDKLPGTAGLCLTLEQLFARDTFLYDFFAQRSVPQAFLMSGGYGPECWEVPARFIRHVLLHKIPHQPQQGVAHDGY